MSFRGGGLESNHHTIARPDTEKCTGASHDGLPVTDAPQSLQHASVGLTAFQAKRVVIQFCLDDAWNLDVQRVIDLQQNDPVPSKCRRRRHGNKDLRQKFSEV